MILTALVTPFLPNYQIDFESLQKILIFQFNSKIEGLVLLGTTAETPTLGQTEQHKIVELALKINSKFGKKLFVGVSDNSTQGVMKKIQNFESLAIDGYLISTPFYNKPPQEGLIEHFYQISKTTQKDIILYNISSRTGVNFLPENILKLLQKTTNIKYIKESCGDISQIMDLVALLKRNDLKIQVLGGDDDLILAILAIGGVGAVSVISNLFPDKFVNLVKQKNLDEFYSLLPTIRECFETTNPIGIKKMLLKNSLIASDQVRLPLVQI